MRNKKTKKTITYKPYRVAYTDEVRLQKLKKLQGRVVYESTISITDTTQEKLMKIWRILNS